MSKKKICLDGSQTERLMTDTAKLAKGIDQDICPTVREMYEENVPRDLRLSKKSKKKKAKDVIDVAGNWFTKRITSKIGKKIDDLF